MDGVAAGSGKRGFRDLTAWQRAMDLVTAVYGATRRWPREEQFGLAARVRRAAVSIPSNIAEGHGRSGPPDLLRHLSIAFGSLREVETRFPIAGRLTSTDRQTGDALMDRLAEGRRRLRGLLRGLRQPSATP